MLRRLRNMIIAGAAIVIVVIGIIGYGVTGLVYASSRVAGADKSLNAVVSHQNNLNSTFKDIDTNFSSLSSNTSFDPVQARTVLDRFVANSKLAGTTIDKDDASLVSAQASLKEQEWLTVVSRGNLDKAGSRIDHARKGLASAKIVTADYVLDGMFFQAFIDSAADLDPLSTQSANADVTGARATLATMKADTDKALQLSTAPGLPKELHDLMVDFQKFVTDFGAILNAVTSGNNTALATAERTVQADSSKMSGYNFDKIQGDMDVFYKPLIDTYNSEMTKATS
ncbi:MAG: hypothetical protein ABI334_10185 [Candidatus Dormiibacterota bacterium]